ncbi:MAG: hypothetical protein CFH06_01606 [Alphaproteobacteria bacterium MarineAlpha3_Bin5]|nr:MAG: hypothetical protein CFH06_01606 [Alphaproteobacteria bacterium MarineAlpha3_Bin5]
MFKIINSNCIENGPKLALRYKNATPFPHIRLGSFLEKNIAQKAFKEFPMYSNPIWNHHKHFNCQKLSANKKEHFPKTIRSIVDELNSNRFASWLSKLVGIPDLRPDPSLMGGGLHQITRGGYLNMHADFTYHHHNEKLKRRVNLLLYLNKEWKQDWGGQIEFWDEGMKECITKSPPLGNNAVIFSTSKTSWHGHPAPLSCPQGHTRNSIALYYYTEEKRPTQRMGVTTFRHLHEDGLLKKLFISLDQKVLYLYSRSKQIFGLSNDDWVTKFLNKIEKLFSIFKKKE